MGLGYGGRYAPTVSSNTPNRLGDPVGMKDEGGTPVSWASSLCFLALVKWAVLLHHTHLSWSPSSCPRNNRHSPPWTETFDTMSPTKCLPLFSQVFCHGNEKAYHSPPRTSTSHRLELQESTMIYLRAWFTRLGESCPLFASRIF